MIQCCGMVDKPLIPHHQTSKNRFVCSNRYLMEIGWGGNEFDQSAVVKFILVWSVCLFVYFFVYVCVCVCLCQAN